MNEWMNDRQSEYCNPHAHARWGLIRLNDASKTRWTGSKILTSGNVALFLLLYTDFVINFYQILLCVNYLCTLARLPFVLKHITSSIRKFQQLYCCLHQVTKNSEFKLKVQIRKNASSYREKWVKVGKWKYWCVKFDAWKQCKKILIMWSVNGELPKMLVWVIARVTVLFGINSTSNAIQIGRDEAKCYFYCFKSAIDP